MGVEQQVVTAWCDACGRIAGDLRSADAPGGPAGGHDGGLAEPERHRQRPVRHRPVGHPQVVRAQLPRVRAVPHRGADRERSDTVRPCGSRVRAGLGVCDRVLVDEVRAAVPLGVQQYLPLLGAPGDALLRRLAGAVDPR